MYVYIYIYISYYIYNSYIYIYMYIVYTHCTLYNVYMYLYEIQLRMCCLKNLASNPHCASISDQFPAEPEDRFQRLLGLPLDLAVKAHEQKTK